MPDRPVIYRGRSYDPDKRPRGKVACPGPHPDATAWKLLADLLCGRCWYGLTAETRRRLELSGGSGRPNPVIRYDQLREQLRAGVPLHEIQVNP
jgi:hypothetical protein